MNDPTRLGDPRSKRSASLRRMIAAGRSDVPEAERMEALAGRLGFGAGAPLAGVGPTKPVAALGGAVKTGVAATLGAATKIGAVAILVLGTAAGVAATGRGSSAPAVVASPAQPVRLSSPRPPLDEKNPEPSSDPSLQPPWQPAPDTAVPEPATDAPASNDHAVMAAPNPTPVAAHQNAVAGPVADTEITLLDEAQAALRIDPQRALDLTAHEASRFPSGTLTQEREVIAIEALTRLGHIDDARERARQFFQTFPRSAHRPRIAALVGLVVDPPIHDPAP